MKQSAFIIIISLFLNGCFIGAGTHGKIKEYKFEYTNEELVTIVDQFLKDNPTYLENVDDSYGWVYIKIPKVSSRFGFRIGGESEIVLISAGKENEQLKWDKDLSLLERKELIKIFEKLFIDRLQEYSPKRSIIIKEPFILSSNQNIDTTLWPHYVFKHDTVIAYSLPEEFDSLGFNFFEDLISSFNKKVDSELSINQFYNIFRVNKDYSGYIGDSIYITNFYRTIGQRELTKPIFETEEWKEYTSRIK